MTRPTAFQLFEFLSALSGSALSGSVTAAAWRDCANELSTEADRWSGEQRRQRLERAQLCLLRAVHIESAELGAVRQ